MGLYKRGQVWWIAFSYQSKQIRRSTETDDKKLAEKIYCKVITDIAEGKWFEKPPAQQRTFRELMTRYMEEHSRPSKASAHRDESSLTHLLPYFGDCLLQDIAPRRINEYKIFRRSKGASPCTINRELALMRHAFTLAIKEWEWIKDNPVQKVSMEKEPPPRDRWLTYEEEERLLSVSPQWLKEILIFALDTGCRQGEILSLTWRDVDWINKVAVIFGKKTGDRRSVPLTQRALSVLYNRRRADGKVKALKEDLVFTYPAGQRVNLETLRSAFKRALRKSEINAFRFHDARHSFASRLAQNGVEAYSIQRLLGHKTFSTSQRYAHHCTASLRKGIETLENKRQDMNEQEVITILSQ